MRFAIYNVTDLRFAMQDGSQIKAKMRELLLELSVLVRIRHPNIVTFWGTAADFPPAGKPYIGMVFELCRRGSLFKALHQNQGKRLPFKERMRCFLFSTNLHKTETLFCLYTISSIDYLSLSPFLIWS